ncbi:putative RNA methylase, NOL1/NOP2/sun family [Thermosinus carboxydivorans Nor1]|uniref:Putative RNA methylase, NOL1/NOP2/sun family n=1 Tax=Thermosinus carboxydivorans Nor1 TaxID=401526 RepID=A1HRN9_9FIRM|nr:RsmF rRNA methyltransferase first C-terminal domain-containing protein [Thermosinus carboxydivorans]EAX47360.1 putative RNA methylase, NOL1/NOP2/sun family [Thermosinus carboxydivorans Nor1]
MHHDLPAAFCQRMQALLADEFAAFYQSYEEPRTYGLRVNTLKITPAELVSLAPFALTPVPWATDGFYCLEEQRPGKHPYHAAGLYYIQEPSAMAAAPLLAPQPGEFVLDLAAAPGGKATHLAAFMQGQGLLIANEVHPARAKILSENIERLGVKNCIVTNETPPRLAERFPAFFDRILVDAPCSGEGMFRKDPAACQEWTQDAPRQCAARQREILADAVRMLKSGGWLLYSTCTFAPEENEEIVDWLLAAYPDLAVVPLPHNHGFASAVPAWGGGRSDLAGAVRLWPHKLRGEGHFLALLRKQGEGKGTGIRPGRKEGKRRADSRLKDYLAFCREFFTTVPEGDLQLFGDHLYLLPPGAPPLDGLKILRPGWHLGWLAKNRFEPSHALAMAITAKDVRYTADYSAADDAVWRYLRGEALPRQGEKGWTLVTVDGYPLGWGKQSADSLKNHYPKGLRWL